MSPDQPIEAIVAGNICLDITPRISAVADGAIIRPGGLTRVGPAVVSSGGAVANTGLALHRLGVPTRLVARIGDDPFGRELIRIVGRDDAALAGHLRIIAGEATSYSIVLSAPEVDRSFLHCPAANDSFDSADLDLAALGPARLLHFGYPPIMRRVYERGAAELIRILRSAREHGMTTSLDLCAIDPASDAAGADWPAILRAALPLVDLFLPSIDELLQCLRRPAIDPQAPIALPLLRDLADELLAMGCAVVVLKLGERGLYARAAPDADRFDAAGAAMQRVDRVGWIGCESRVGAFEIDLVNATGAGDCAIAGFLAAVLRGESLESASTAAAATGAVACESPDASSIPDWSAVEQRIAAGWAAKGG